MANRRPAASSMLQLRPSRRLPRTPLNRSKHTPPHNAKYTTRHTAKPQRAFVFHVLPVPTRPSPAVFRSVFRCSCTHSPSATRNFTPQNNCRFSGALGGWGLPLRMDFSARRKGFSVADPQQLRGTAACLLIRSVTNTEVPDGTEAESVERYMDQETT